VPRAALDRLRRWFLKNTLPHRGLFGTALALGRLAKPLLPAGVGRRFPSAMRAARGPSRGTRGACSC